MRKRGRMYDLWRQGAERFGRSRELRWFVRYREMWFQLYFDPLSDETLEDLREQANGWAWEMVEQRIRHERLKYWRKSGTRYGGILVPAPYDARATGDIK